MNRPLKPFQKPSWKKKKKAGNAQRQAFWYSSLAHKRISNKELEGVCMGFSSITFWHSSEDSADERNVTTWMTARKMQHYAISLSLSLISHTDYVSLPSFLKDKTYSLHSCAAPNENRTKLRENVHKKRYVQEKGGASQSLIVL